ncbi:transporter substrate-binding domain-containing protein [Maricurvus nonylphenolicus]|uniref:substrate-binding periplasmic protein n=1 Tax=Maricurvus nonylphenolicus TaxID=1008307 RepID=UPI0036F24D25
MLMIRSLIIVFSVAWVSVSGAQDKLVFPTVSNSPLSKALETVIHTAYGRLGIDVEVVHLPRKRGLMLSSQGLYDGELARTTIVLQKFPNLIRVPVTLYCFDIVAYTHHKPLPVVSWEGLKGLSVGVTLGMMKIEAQTVDLKTVKVVNLNQLFKMLATDRIDVVVANRLIGAATVLEGGFDNIVINDPPLTQTPIYHFLHDKHRGLLNDITEVLEQMLRSGELAQIYKNYAQQHLNLLSLDADAAASIPSLQCHESS